MKSDYEDTRDIFDAPAGGVAAFLALVVFACACPASGQMWPQNAQWRASTATHADGSGPVTASDVTVLDVAGLYLETNVETALAAVRTRPVFAAAQADVPSYGLCDPSTDAQWYYVTDASPSPDLAGAIVACAVGANQWLPLFAPWRHASAHLVGEADAIVADQLETDCTDGQLLIGETDVDSNTGLSVGCLTPSYLSAGAATSSGLTMSTSRLLGRTTASTGAVEEITVLSPLSLSGGALGLATVGLASGGTGAALTDPGADRLAFWDDSAGSVAWLTLGTGLSITDTTLDASGGGGLGGATGSADNAILCSDGTGGATVQACNTTSTVIEGLAVKRAGAGLATSLLFQNEAGVTRGSLVVDPADGEEFVINVSAGNTMRLVNPGNDLLDLKFKGVSGVMRGIRFEGRSGSWLTGTEEFQFPNNGDPALAVGDSLILLRKETRLSDPGTRPTCDSTHRGTIWYDAGGAGVADTFAVCGKSSLDVYAWVASATF